MKIAASAFILLAAVPNVSNAEVTRARYLMGTVCEVGIGGGVEPEQQIAAAFDEAARIEAFLSTWRSESELSALNRSGDRIVSEELSKLLRESVRLSSDTNGAFNPLLRPLIAAWKTREAGAIPSRSAIATGLRASALSNVRFIEPSRVVLRGGAQFEEGGFGKGYAIDRMFRSITARTAFINFGGQIAVRGEREVTVADPSDRNRPVIAFTIQDASLSTSSGSEKTFEAAGRTFSHILDPRTGEALPPRGSASVISADALTADVHSTALYVMGVDEGLRWADEKGVAALFITDSSIHLSRAFRDRARAVVVLDSKFKLKD